MNAPTKSNAIAILLFCLVTASFAQGDQPVTLKNYLKQCEILLQEGGKWRANNKDYNPQDEWSARYFGYEFQRGVGPNTLKLKINGYLPKHSQWFAFWEGSYTWDGKKKTVVYSSVNTEGTIASGESESITESGITLVFTLTKPDGTVETHKDIQRLDTSKIISESFVQEGGKWVPKNSMTWVRLEQPKGVITFMSTRDGNFEVYSMKASGDSLVNLTCNKATDYTFSYAPGGRLVFYTNRDGNEEIYVTEADGKKTTNLTNNPAGDRNASVSPDGSKILFSSYRDAKEPDLYVMNIDGSDARRLTNNDKYEDAASWSPDGKGIFFSRDVATGPDDTPNGEIFVMDIDGRNDKRLTNRPGFDGGPQLSPDGSKIAFYGRTAAGVYEIFLMDPDGKNVVNLTDDTQEDYSPSWSPDGKWIAYTRGNSSNYDVWVINIETRIKYRLTSQPKRDESPIWR